MTTYAAANPYELWSTRKSLGVFRDTRAEDWYFGQFFTKQMRSETEWIDFEKLPIRSRKLAPFVKPGGRGHGLFSDKVQGYRFKPANLVVEDSVDPLRPLTFQPGIDQSAFDMSKITPMQRTELIKAEMMAEFRLGIERRWEWMKAKAIIDAAVTCTYRDGTVAVVDFQRASGHTQVLTSGNKWGDSGVSIVNSIQTIFDTVNNAVFGGTISRITVGSNVVPVIRADTEIKGYLDLTKRGSGEVNVARGLIGGGPNGGKVYKFGEMSVGGGASGQQIEIWVNNETYDADDGTQTRYLGANDVIYTSDPSAVNGYECFGMIVDRDAEYQAIPAFPKNFLTGDRTKVENMSIESAPLFVPINPNATFKQTAV
jgi:hypothetical protein